LVLEPPALLLQYCDFRLKLIDDFLAVFLNGRYYLFVGLELFLQPPLHLQVYPHDPLLDVEDVFLQVVVLDE
jgi:hypothetical protein